VLRDKAAVRRVLGYLPQDFGVYPKVSAEDMLDHLARLKAREQGERADVVASLLRQTNLYDVRKKALGGYSGGMRQRFGIAQALLGNPKLIIVDEPTAGLDPEERTRFHNLLVEIGEEVIVVLSTHIVSDVSDLCPRLAIMTTAACSSAARRRSWSTRSPGASGRPRSRAPTSPPARAARGDLDAPLHRQDADQRDCRRFARRGFRAVEPTLEDAYFAAIGGHLGANGAAAGQVVTEGAVFASARVGRAARCRRCWRSPGSSSARA